jgi:hypothetical protein
MLVNEASWPNVLNNPSAEEAERAGLMFFAYKENWQRKQHHGAVKWTYALDPKVSKAYC